MNSEYMCSRCKYTVLGLLDILLRDDDIYFKLLILCCSGFFFAHVGWLLCKKHPDVKAKGKGIDLSDLENDPVLRFQKR